MSKFVRKLMVIGLITAMLLGIGATVGIKYENKVNGKVAIVEQQEDVTTKITILEDKVQECGELKVASGTVKSSYEFNRYNHEVAEKKGNALVALHKLLYERSVEITADYNYNVMYDLGNIRVEMINNVPTFILYESDIVINDIYEKEGTVELEVTKGLVPKGYTDHEKQVMRDFARVKVRNYLITENTVAKGSMESLKDNIRKLADSLNVKVDFIVYENRTLATIDQMTTISNHTQVREVFFS